DVLLGDVAAERRLLLDGAEDALEAADGGSGEGLDGPGADRVDADALGPEVGGEVAHAGFEGGLCDAHDVVVLDDAGAAVVGERDDVAAARRQERGGVAGEVDEGE